MQFEGMTPSSLMPSKAPSGGTGRATLSYTSRRGVGRGLTESRRWVDRLLLEKGDFSSLTSPGTIWATKGRGTERRG